MNNLTNFISICETELDLYQKLVIEKKTDPNLTFYKSLPLCIIDAVFSIGVKYTSVMKAEENFISYFKLDIPRTYPVKCEYTVNDFISHMDSIGSFEKARIPKEPPREKGFSRQKHAIWLLRSSKSITLIRSTNSIITQINSHLMLISSKLKASAVELC